MSPTVGCVGVRDYIDERNSIKEETGAMCSFWVILGGNYEAHWERVHSNVLENVSHGRAD